MKNRVTTKYAKKLSVLGANKESKLEDNLKEEIEVREKNIIERGESRRNSAIDKTKTVASKKKRKLKLLDPKEKVKNLQQQKAKLTQFKNRIIVSKKPGNKLLRPLVGRKIKKLTKKIQKEELTLMRGKAEEAVKSILKNQKDPNLDVQSKFNDYQNKIKVKKTSIPAGEGVRRKIFLQELQKVDLVLVDKEVAKKIKNAINELEEALKTPQGTES